VIDLTTRVAKVYHKGHYSMVFGHPSFAKKLHAFAKKLWQLKAGGKKRSDGFFPPPRPNALIPAQRSDGFFVLAKAISMIVRFW